ncbi:transcriptional regulator [Thiosulfatimonas sediminis]|uniref:Transcriptional regulator n=1 Tax=Thiosulfatimonas sediminis TaxID=2675054 RepID=A0A6F8PWZ9_9GAMM|nr:AAA family ATPase [Thiosulfatimonas sediminis]BBP46651.1 transcriptional regulator [Thiosulfatimonas sediminis]
MDNTVNLHQALYVGSDRDLLEAVSISIRSKYSLELMVEVPKIWPEDTSLVLIEYDGDSKTVINRINQILTLAQGVAVFVLLKEKDADFLIEASHQGVQGFIECPDEVFNILSILHMQDRRRIGKNGNVSAFFSLKGGVGRTALATNVAAHIADLTHGRSVLVDLNMPLGDTVLYLNMENQRLYTITDFIYNINRFDEDLIYNSLSRHDSGLYLLSLPSDIGELDGLNAELIKTVIQSLRRYFDHVVIDLSSDLSDATLSCLDEADNVVLIAEPSLSSLRAVNTAIQLSQKLGYVKESLKLVVNRSTPNSDVVLDDVIDSLEIDTVIRVSNDYHGFNESLKEGQLLSRFKPDAIVNRQLFSLAHMLHNGVLKTDELIIPSFRKEVKPSIMEQFNQFLSHLLTPKRNSNPEK